MRACLALSLCLIACGNQNPSSDGGSDATADAAVDAVGDGSVGPPQDSDTDADPSACNALSNVGAAVPQMFVATNPVAGDGGNIRAGTYVLTAAAVYTGPGGNAGPTGTVFTDTLALADDGTYERVVSSMGDAGLDGLPQRQNGRFATDGGGIRVTLTCPVGPQPFTSYDSDGARVRIYAPAVRMNPGVMFEYTRR